MKTAIISGASGMIGSHLSELLSENNIHVIAVVRPDSKKLENVPRFSNLQIIECDLQNISALCDKKIAHADVFYHFAWDGVFGEDRNNLFSQTNNIQFSLNAIKTASVLGCKKFVFAGSQAEYGLQNRALTVQTQESPITPYGIAKNTVTHLGKIFSEQLGMEFCSGRILSSYGERDNLYTMVSSLILKLLKGETCNLSSCTQIWDYVYAKDVANAFFCIAERGVHGKAYPIGSGIGKPLKEFTDEIYALVGNERARLNYGAIKLDGNAVTHLQSDISELCEDTGFNVQYTFRDGIFNTIQWLKTKLTKEV